MPGLRRLAGVAAVVALAVTGGALIVAFVAAGGARAASRELSQRLVPAATLSNELLGNYTAQQTSLRDYVTSGQPAALAPFRAAQGEIGGREARLARLARPYRAVPARLTGAIAAHRAWLVSVAAAQLDAAARGDFIRARALQADLSTVRPAVLAVRSRMAAVQAQITDAQRAVTDRLVRAQNVLVVALVVMCGLVAATGAAVGLAVRRSLLAARANQEKAQQGFRRLFDSSPDASLAVGADGSIVMVNAQAERLFGYSAEELVGQQVELLVPEAARAMHRAHRGGYFADPAPRPMGAGLRLSAVRRDGGELPVEISLNGLQTDRGLVVTAAVRDVSERLAAEAERERLRAEAERERVDRRLLQSQRLQSLGQLVGGVAHDFNNLLNIILGYTGFVAEQVTTLSGSDERLEPVLADIEQVRDAAQHATQLTRQLLTFARHDVARPETLDMGVVVAELEDMLRRTIGEHVELTITVGPGLRPVRADRGQLGQILVNLAVNARDAMPGGGKLTIETTNTDVDATYAASRPDLQPGSYVRLRVSDTGAGMDRATLDRVFEPFFTTKEKGHGTGLGLATVYGIITTAGGNIEIYSEPGLGTTVTALLPAAEDRAAPRAATAEPVPHHGHGETILLVEDEESLRKLASRILARNGYRVRSATTATEAVRQAGDLEQTIDLLLTDVVMPEMLGNEVAERIRAIRPHIRVLYMSGYAEAVLNTHGALDAEVALLEKPFSETALLTQVRQALDYSHA